MTFPSKPTIQSAVRKTFVKSGLTGVFFMFVTLMVASSPPSTDSLTVQPVPEKKLNNTEKGWYSTSLYGEFGMPKMVHSSNELHFDDSYSYGAGISFNFRFTNWIGMQFGAGLTMNNINLRVDEYNDQVNAVDNEGDTYLKIVNAKEVTEEQSWLWLNVPVSLNLFYGIGRSELHAFGGLELRHALKADFNQTGVFTHHGFYEEYNILFDDLPALGFYTDRKLKSEDQLNPELLFVPYTGIGFLAPGKKCRFYLEARYYLKSNDPFADKQSSLFPGPDNNQPAGQFKNNSVMNYGDVSFGGIKLVLGINF